MKTYTAPALVAKGEIVAITQGRIIGTTDPDGVSMPYAPGSVGFSL